MDKDPKARILILFNLCFLDNSGLFDDRFVTTPYLNGQQRRDVFETRRDLLKKLTALQNQSFKLGKCIVIDTSPFFNSLD
ncbi:hypothetical protein P3L10_026552 [Capsicum annuum]